ncbi:hypothetical protein C2S52_019843 [Perilla frutescens var. hirtella]|uniref:SWIM-type domain-containing protein n=1 Tax=Perilla frutescens var. hirtella TaxID=608512 RepID=A0AAD4J2N7_PERFH|nr:hypothetical protein C2S52_019843 [Perilla frutescens var. hirtella]KAH6805930.1 hypothetical protein C2S51_030761 [Perilla frutescens var. frutescens]KAH6825726.1 hypothetical protein C2S53_018318 [Perilla frutescens var. hirtella]
MGRPPTMTLTRARVYGFLIVAALAASAAATVVHPIPKKELRKRRPANFFKKAVPQLSPALYVPTFNREQEEYVNAHNTIRESMGMPPLAWDAKLAASANEWAEKRRRDCSFRKHSKNPYGENIYFMNYREFTPTDVVRYWFSESKYYDGVRNRCTCDPQREGCECGHFLSVVWKTTQRVGCSRPVYCDHQKGVVIVCEYDPPGCVDGINPFTGMPL